MEQLALVVSYDGTDFHGSQVQPGKRTVQGELGDALHGLFGTRPVTTFAGRTDRGVHAARQVVSLDDLRPDLSLATIGEALNARLPSDLAIVSVRREPAGFNARYDARWREYRYRVWSGKRAPLAADRVWWRRASLDLGRMAEASAQLAGTHDFASFAGGGEGVPWSERQQRPKGTVRTLFVSEVRVLPVWWGPTEADELLVEYRVVGTGFLPQMVRTIVAAIVDVGRGTRPTDWIGELLARPDRRAAGGTAEASGLTLWQIGYEDWPEDTVRASTRG